MRRKTLAVIMTGILICAAFSGCGEDVDGSDTSNIASGIGTTSSQAIPQSLKKDLNNQLHIDADIVSPAKLPQVVCGYRAEPIEFNKSIEPIVLKTFFPKGNYEATINREDQPTLSGKKQQYLVFDEKGKNDVVETTEVGFSGTPEEKVDSSPIQLKSIRCLNCATPLGYKMILISNEDTGCPGAIQRFRFSNQNLEFKNRKNAEKECRDFLKKLNIPIDKTLYWCYAWTSKTEQTQKNALQKDGGFEHPFSDFKKEDECYAFKFYDVVDGMAVADFPVVTTGMEDPQSAPGASISLIYGKSGIAEVHIEQIYQPTGKEGNSGKPVSFEIALSQAVKRLNSTFSTSVTTITKIEFAYAPRRLNKKSAEVLLRPAWIFDYKTNSISSEGNRQVIIDALTGEEMK